jgi:hypothetical protein
MRVSVQTTVSVVALASTGFLAASVVSAANSPERRQRHAGKKAAGKTLGKSEAGFVKASRVADPPPPWIEASKGGGASKLREAAQ